MATRGWITYFLWFLAAALATLWLASCAPSTETGSTPATGGATATGGIRVTGGAPATGGASATGGATATGGTTGTGGATATGGATGTGGATATGGTTGTGGATGTGGRGGGTTGAAGAAGTAGRGGATGAAGMRGGAGTTGGAGRGGAAGGAGAAGRGGAAGSCDEANGYHLAPQGDACTNAPRMLCVFDYDLTLSSHACPQTMSMPAQYLCRRNANGCLTYSWYDQCLATDAPAAIAECVRRGAYIGITSHSTFEECWNDKVVQTMTPSVFPELFSSIHYDKPGTDFSYPAIDNRANWNCDTCAYHFDGTRTMSKSVLIRKVMAHYGLSPTSAADQRRVVFWDDDPNNVQNVRTNLPNAAAIAVATIGPATNREGCGISPPEINAGWAALAASAR